MNYGAFLAAALLAAAPTPNAADIVATPFVASHSPVSSAPAPVAPSTPTPAIGESAPDFAYQSRDYLWQNLHNMLEQASVLLVFGATDEELRSLERDQEALVGRGVIPVAVVGQREGEVWRTVRRDALTYSLLADPHAAIAGQYGAIDPATNRPRKVWFVIDRTGRIRGEGEGASAPGGWNVVAASALGLADTRTAGTR